MGGGARRTAFFEARFKKSRAALPIDFGCFLLRWDKQGRKAQQRRSGAKPAERSKATLLTAKDLRLARQQGPVQCRVLVAWAGGATGAASASLAGRSRGTGATAGRNEGRRQAEETTGGRSAERGTGDEDATRAGPTERGGWENAGASGERGPGVPHPAGGEEARRGACAGAARPALRPAAATHRPAAAGWPP